jgi:hypothetical protein
MEKSVKTIDPKSDVTLLRSAAAAPAVGTDVGVVKVLDGVEVPDAVESLEVVTVTDGLVAGEDDAEELTVPEVEPVEPADPEVESVAPPDPEVESVAPPVPEVEAVEPADPEVESVAPVDPEAVFDVEAAVDDVGESDDDPDELDGIDMKLVVDAGGAPVIVVPPCVLETWLSPPPLVAVVGSLPSQ